MLRRYSLCTFIALTLGLGSHLVYSATLGARDSTSSTSALRDYLEEWRTHTVLETRQQQQETRTQTKRFVAHEVIARRMSMAVAIDQFQGLYPEGVEPMLVGRSDAERLGLSVIRWVALELHDAPSHRDMLIPQLEVELARHLRMLERAQQTANPL